MNFPLASSTPAALGFAPEPLDRLAKIDRGPHPRRDAIRAPRSPSPAGASWRWSRRSATPAWSRRGCRPPTTRCGCSTRTPRSSPPARCGCSSSAGRCASPTPWPSTCRASRPTARAESRSSSSSPTRAASPTPTCRRRRGRITSCSAASCPASRWSSPRAPACTITVAPLTGRRPSSSRRSPSRTTGRSSATTSSSRSAWPASCSWGCRRWRASGRPTCTSRRPTAPAA